MYLLDNAPNYLDGGALSKREFIMIKLCQHLPLTRTQTNITTSEPMNKSINSGTKYTMNSLENIKKNWEKISLSFICSGFIQENLRKIGIEFQFYIIIYVLCKIFLTEFDCPPSIMFINYN